MNFLLDLSCEKSIKGNHATFVTISLSALCLSLASLLNDNLGRKNTFFVSSLLSVLGAVVSLARLEYHLIVAGMFLQVLGTRPPG